MMNDNALLRQHCRDVIRACLNIVEEQGDTFVAIHKDEETECVVLVSMIRTYPIMSIIVADKILFAKENEVDMYRSANAMNAESLTGWHSIFLTDSSSIYMYRQCIWVNDHLDEDSLMEILCECIAEYRRGRSCLAPDPAPPESTEWEYEKGKSIMKKRVTALVLALALSLGMCVSASAASFVPDDVTYQNLNGQQLAIKVYTLLPDQDPSSLEEPDFEYDGYLYAYSSIVKEEQTFNEQNSHTETVTITTSSKDLEDILAELKPTMEYDDGHASGTLALDHSTIKTEAAGYKQSSYTVTATKNYTGLDRNDSTYIDKTVVKNGRTLSLSNVTWSVESTALVGDELVPATYTAVATYSGTASSKVATGYITTAEYTGTVSASGVSSIQYTVTYIGTPVQPESESLGTLPLIGIICLVAMGGLLLIVLLTRKNTTVYEATGKGKEYDRCGRFLLKAKRPELRIDRLKKVPEGVIAVEVDERVARKLFGKKISIRYYNAIFEHTVGEVNGPYWFKVDVGSSCDEPLEEENT